MKKCCHEVQKAGDCVGDKDVRSEMLKFSLGSEKRVGRGMDGIFFH